MTTPPKLFISYSWSSPDHEKWVLELAEELVSQGINVQLDKWDLREGHDSNAFMESMVTDSTVTKVVLIFDRIYAEKSDARAGGAGTEAQIITPQLYAKKAQDKFVAVIRERDPDGNPYTPVYYKGRIYIDLTDDSKYAQEFERLVRWAYDKPQFVKPELGKMPNFLAEPDAPKLNTSVAFKRSQEAIRLGKDNASSVLQDYLETVIAELVKFRITPGEEPFDEDVVKSVEAFTPFRNELIETFLAIARTKPSEEMLRALQRFFEGLIPYLDRSENMSEWREDQFDNFRFIAYELFLYCIAALLKYERFSSVQRLIDVEYYDASARNNDAMKPYTVFQEHMRSLYARGKRIRRVSASADLLKERATATGIEFRQIMAADFILYLRQVMTTDWAGWHPETLIYARHYSVTFEIFARARSVAYFNQIKGILGAPTADQFKDRMRTVMRDTRMVPSWDYQRVGIGELARVDEIATTL